MCVCVCLNITNLFLGFHWLNQDKMVNCYEVEREAYLFSSDKRKITDGILEK